MFQKTTAAREKVKLKVGLAGPSGSGKTLSALKLAYGITGDWTKIAVADTENSSALYYAGDMTGPWEHIPFDAKPETQGYHPNNWIKLIDFAEKDPNTEVLLLDSFSHEWEGQGGCLDLIEKIGKGFTGWKMVTPLHTAVIDKIRNSRLHIIATMRTKQDYVIEQNEKGKSSPRKVGTKSNQREGTDYEFGIIFDIEHPHHLATTSKDRTGLFASRGPFLISPETGRELLEWANSGIEPVEEVRESVSVYDASESQKKAFAKLCIELGVSDKTRMAELSSLAQGVPLTDLRTFVTAHVDG